MEENGNANGNENILRNLDNLNTCRTQNSFLPHITEMRRTKQRSLSVQSSAHINNNMFFQIKNDECLRTRNLSQKGNATGQYFFQEIMNSEINGQNTQHVIENDQMGCL